MSQEDVFAQEVQRRRDANINLERSLIEINTALEQINDLDETFKDQQEDFANRLKCIYTETRHYTGKWPIVYDNSKVEDYPFFRGETDAECNPYFRITQVVAGTEDGISPVFSEPTRAGVGGGNDRDRDYIPENGLESALRATALAALQAYPDRSGEAGEFICVGETPSGSGTNQTLCEDNGGVWTAPEYEVGATAPELLEAALDPWRTAIVQLKADLCADELEDESAADTLLQNIIDEIDKVKAELPAPPTYPDQTPNLTNGCSNPSYTDKVTCELNGEIWLQDLKDAIEALEAYIQIDLPADVDTRGAKLAAKATNLEQKHFSMIGLRLHQINGSFAKVQSLKDQKKTNSSLIQDNVKSIAQINVLRVNNS